MHDTSSVPTLSTERHSLAWAVWLVLGITAARIVYLIAMCPYELVEDEAHYWEWSRRLDWSYYSKGPGVAAVIRLMTELFGHAEWAVRLPAAIAGGVAALCVGGLARDVARHAGMADTRRAALFGAAAIVLAPIFQFPAILMTIDGPYVACWAAAAWAAWRALMQRSGAGWVALGVAMGAGFAFKYTIVLLVPGVVLFAIVERRRLAMPRRVGAWIVLALVLALGGLVPIGVWNAQRDWPTVRHLLGHLGMSGGDMPVAASVDESGGGALGERVVEHVGGFFEFVFAQIGMVGPMLALGVLGWWYVRRTRDEGGEGSGLSRDGALYLVCCAAPIIVFYLGVTLVAEAEQNWAMGGYVTLMALAGWSAALMRAREGGRGEVQGTRGVRRLWRAGVVYGVVAAIILPRLDLVMDATNAVRGSSVGRKVWSEISGKDPGEQRPMVLGRLSGSREMAQEAAGQLSKIEDETGRAGFIMTDHYGRASLMAYYTFRIGEPAEVYCTSALMGGRKTQYDMWAETDITLMSVHERLVGRDAILFSNDKPWKIDEWERFFRRVEPIGKFPGEHKKDRIAYRGWHYHGITAKHEQDAADAEGGGR